MNRTFVILLLVSVSSIVCANSAFQTDWSGGPGIPGPATLWGSSFDSCVSAGYDAVPGVLLLTSPLGAHLIGDDVDTPVALVMADFDGDGSDDAAAIGSSGLSWWRNADGNGTSWEYNVISDIGVSQAWMDVSDLDLDGDQDLVVSVSSQGLFWWENHGNGTTWTSHTIMDADVRECRCADFNGDGMDDIALMVWGTSDVMWWRNRLSTSHDWAAEYIDGSFVGSYTCDPADIDGDGTMDLAAASYGTGEIRCYIRQPGGSWEAVTVTTGFEHPVSVRAADFNGDGLMDVASVCWTNGYLSWWANPATGDWQMHTLATDMTGASYVLPADMDGDGDFDILATAFDVVNGLRWYDNLDGQGLSWDLVEAFSCYQARSICLGDVNGDGIHEIAAPSACQDLARYWRIAGFDSPGEVISSIYDTSTPEDINWDYLHWDSVEPSGTDIRVAIRGSSNSGSMGEWSDWLSSSTPLAGLLDPTDRFIQYKVELTTTDPWLSPLLNDISFLWSVTGIESGSDAEEPLVLVGSNPSFGSFQLDFNLPTAGPADLSVFDLSGRLVASPASGYFEAGTHSALVTSLPAGIYVCRYAAPEVTAQLQVVVVR